MLLEKSENSEKLLAQTIISHKQVLKEKDQVISNLKHEASIHSAQLESLLSKHQSCHKQLESIQVNCQKWVESCKGYKMFLNHQSKNNVKFGLWYTHTQGPSDYTPKVQVYDNESNSSILKETVNTDCDSS
ncbi:hypothetical protein Hanom_Chr10g00929671 [Helianthus anomalus]